ncbi:hypothetical protein B7494_g1470 [Chlorociboria aeruginascens]|nr:hypothetical protein B7494_g1470 [Chlorociboria aeruginascens]
MATAPMAADTSRLSFAKVAASAGKDNVALTSFVKVASSAAARKENVSLHQISIGEGLASTTGVSTVDTTTDQILPKEQRSGVTPVVPKLEKIPTTTEDNLVGAIKVLSVHNAMPSLVVNGSGVPGPIHKSETSEGFAEDPFQRADSGSELGTKPASLDGKSNTSATTFALDEKESLRPDDSASVKAAEDDDTFSGRGSIVAGSRIGSEAAARAYRAQFYDGRNMHPMQERQNQGIVTPQSGSSGQQTTDDTKQKPLVGTAGVPDAFNLFYRQTPDEKLLEALESPKDRIFLLRLEQDVIEFVKDSKEPFIDLPPYAVAGAVRIFRTPFCRLPPSLTSISNPPTSGNTPPPSLPAMKIMRRGGDGDTGPSPSKTTSETGSDSKDKALSAKEKLSREEREAAYNKARERIFGKEEKSGDATPDTEDGNEMSRSSSVSAKDRSSQGKRGKTGKQRRDDSESFDVRSQYTPFFPQQQQQAWVGAPQYAPIGLQQFNGAVQNNFQNPIVPQYGPPHQPFNPAMMNNGNLQQYNNQFIQPNQPRFPPHSAPITAFGSPVQSPPAAPPQQWPQNPYQSPYQARGPATVSPNSIPYAFGQLPSSANPADAKSQHPIPGSFNRHAFNPKTQSFVPGNPGLPPQPMSHHGSPHHGSPHHGSPHLAYSTFGSPQQQFGNGMGYSMARQGSNTSLPSYHASPHMAHRPVMHQGMPQGIPQGPSYVMPQTLPHGMPQSNGQVGSHLPNFGNPSTLPPKPPTGI